MTKKDLAALAAALLACIIWSGSFVIARGVHESIQPITLAFWRWMVAVIFIIPISYKYVIAQWSIIKNNWRYLVFMGCFSVGIFNSMVYYAAHFTTSHHIAIISSTAPIWTLVLAIILGIDKFSWFKILGAILAFAGALIVISHGNLYGILAQQWNHGDIILLASALVWAIYCVMLHFKPKNLHPKSFMCAIIIIGVIFLLPFYLWEAKYIAATKFSITHLSIYLYLGLGSSIIAWFAWNYSIQMIGSVKTGLVYYTIPIFSSIIAIFTLHEPIQLYHWLGFGFVFMGIVTSNIKYQALYTEPS